jgi:hypothetical protein
MDPKVLLTRTRRMCTPRPRQWSPRRKAWFVLRTRTKDVYLRYVPYRGFNWYRVCWRGGSHADAIVSIPHPEFSVKRVQPATAALTGGPTHLAAVETNVLHAFPSLVAHCSVVRYEDGSVRKPGWFLIGTMGSTWTLTVGDPDSDCRMRLNASSCDDVFALADLMLSSADAPWEQSQGRPGANGKAKKGS